jgi:hypothetical protein
MILNKPKKPAGSHGTSTELDLLIYKGKHA